MKSILVTGGTGFIGSHTCLALIERGYHIIAFDSLKNSSQISLNRVLQIHKNHNSNLKGSLKFIKGDLRNLDDIKNIFIHSRNNGKTIEGVIHFGGLKAVAESIKYPIKYWENNVSGTINLIKVMREFGCNKLVFSSSATVYGGNSSESISEGATLEPQNPYGVTKAIIEKFLLDISKNSEYDWRIVILRYFNPIGAHFSGLIGEDPFGIPNNIFPYITQVAIGKLREFKVFGNDWPTSDGTGVRDFIHVMDLAEGHLEAFKFLLNTESRITYLNLGTGHGTSVMELINTFQEVNKLKIPFVIKDRRQGDVPRLVADNTLACSKLNWKPTKTLDDMCIDGWKWQVMNPNGYERTL